MTENVEPEDAQPGDRILFAGYPPHVPMTLASTWGTIQEVTARGVWVVKADEDAYGVRRIRPAMARRVTRPSTGGT